MSRIGLFLRYALFGQPIGVTVREVAAKLRPGARPRRAPRPAQADFFDAERGTDSGGQISALKLATGSSADTFNVGYISSNPAIIRRLLKDIPDLETATFIDIGCGKGRPLLVASEFPFKRIIGVELNPGLADVARANARVIAERYPERTTIEIVCGDVRDFAFPDGYLVVYFYNSVYKPLIKILARKLAAHVNERASKIMLLYYNPAEARIFDGCVAFTRMSTHRFETGTDHGERAPGSQSVVVWQSNTAPLLPAQPGAGAKVQRAGGGLVGKVVAPADVIG